MWVRLNLNTSRVFISFEKFRRSAEVLLNVILRLTSKPRISWKGAWSKLSRPLDPNRIWCCSHNIFPIKNECGKNDCKRVPRLHRETLKALHVNLKPNGEIVPVIFICKHVTVTELIVYFRVTSNLCFKARLKALSICQNWPAGPLPHQSVSKWNRLFPNGFRSKTISFLHTI